MRAIYAICMVLALAGCALLAACAPAPHNPVYVTTALPAIPAECTAPGPREPKLHGDGADDIDDLAAVKDRIALKSAFRTERHYRRTCADRLKVVLPETR